MFCKKCGAKNSKNAKYCSQCSAALTEQGSANNYQANNSGNPTSGNYGSSANYPSAKKSPKLYVILSAIALVAALIAVGFTIYGKVKNNDNENDNIENDNIENQQTIYPPTPSPGEETITPGGETTPQFNGIKVGDEITFGKYEKDNNTSNGKEDIKWLVLDVEGDKALVISKYALDVKRYNEDYENITWEDCTLRNWLNDDFYNAAFSKEEQAQISTTTVKAEDNPKYGTDAGNDTKDKVFLLSISEAEEYFSSDSDRECKPTAYAESQGVFVKKSGSYEGNCLWWLRSPGYYRTDAASVHSDGGVYHNGYSVTHLDIGAVRPALWINIE